MRELHTIHVCNKYMVSFDEVSLFISIPLKECIDRAVSCIIEGNIKLKLSKTDLAKHLAMATA